MKCHAPSVSQRPGLDGALSGVSRNLCFKKEGRAKERSEVVRKHFCCCSFCLRYHCYSLVSPPSEQISRLP